MTASLGSRQVVLDKIASATRNCALSREVKLSPEFRCKEGDVVAARVLTRKSTYNQLELTTGRFSSLRPGDVIAGALGHRRALCGYAGHLPERLAPGDTVDILNLGGVLGICDSVNPDIGTPFQCEVLGQILHYPYLGHRVGVPANISQGLPPMDDVLDCLGVPVVAVVGTAMNAGKTAACTALIQELVRRRLRVGGGKATGVSLMRDVLAMEDAGAYETASFTDFGVVTTVRGNAPKVTRKILTRVASARPDVIVLELGDGLMGTYGVDAILEDEAVRNTFAAVVLCAQDPVGAWGGIRFLEENYGIKTDVVTGPATDNIAGTELIEERFLTRAWNARVNAAELADLVCEKIAAVGSSNDATLIVSPPVDDEYDAPLEREADA